MADVRAEFALRGDQEWAKGGRTDKDPGVLCDALSGIIRSCAAEVFGVRSSCRTTPYAISKLQDLIKHLVSKDPLWWVYPATVIRVAQARARVRTLWDVQLAAQRLGLKIDRSTANPDALRFGVQKAF